MSNLAVSSVEKLHTGIIGFDDITLGGLPAGRSTLVSGTSGSGKTVFACQFLAAGISKGEPGVYVTFEEPIGDIRSNMLSFGWDIAAWEAAGQWAFVDGSPQPEIESVLAGSYDLGALLSRIEHAIRKVNARRLALDSISGIYSQFHDPELVRRELFRLMAALKSLKTTSILTAERVDDQGPLSRYGVEEFVTDNVVLLKNAQDQEKRRRTVEVLKLRGTNHQKGEYPFTVTPNLGIMVLPLSSLELRHRASKHRISSGCSELDRMCGGGLLKHSLVLISGPTGTGKTLITTHFLAGVNNHERALLLAFEESRDQIFRNAQSWGMDFDSLESRGQLKVVCAHPESATLEDHLVNIKAAIEAFKPDRLAVDSLTALERIASVKGFREFVIALTAYVKQQEITSIFTATTTSLVGGPSATESHISSITDMIVLLRYVEVFGEMRRGLTVLKMRGSDHVKEIRELRINSQGMQIGDAFRHVTGILSGMFGSTTPPTEMERLGNLFKEDENGRNAEGASQA